MYRERLGERERENKRACKRERERERGDGGFVKQMLLRK